MTKRPRRRTAAKIATKREQTGLVETAERLAEDPTPLIPRLEGRAPRGAVRRLERRLRRISAARDSERRLRWYARWGSRLTRSYAHLILTGKKGGARRMGSIKTPIGEVKYAARENLSPRVAAAVQHFHQPEVRLLGYRELAQKTGGIVWAVPDGVALTAHADPPPEDWYDLVLERTDLPLVPTDDGLRTEALVDVDELDDAEAPFALRITLAPGPIHITMDAAAIAAGALGKGRSVLSQVATYILGLHGKKDITVRPLGTPTHCHHPGKRCLWLDNRPTPGVGTLARYLEGVVDEHDLLEHLRPRWEEAVKGAGGRLYVAGDACYGDDPERLLDALGLEGAVRAATAEFLAAGPDVVFAAEPSLNKVLEATWSAAPKVLVRLHPRPEELDALLDRHKRSPPAIILDEVLAERLAAERLAGYPRYRKLPLGAAVADRIVRAYKTGGSAGAIDTVDKELKRDSHKGILWAALMRFETTQGRAWQFDKNDQEAGGFLLEPLRTLLEATPDTYHEALQQVHTLSGGTGELPRAQKE